jgi:hemolysin III
MVALPAGAVLVWRDSPGGGVGLYAVALVGLHAVSASYHLCPWALAGRRRIREVDPEMLYLFIAASTTPYCLLAVPGELSDVVLGFVWFGAGAAVVVIATLKGPEIRLVDAGAWCTLPWTAC